MVNLSSNNSNNINLSGQTQRNVNISTPNTNNVDANTIGNSQRARSWAIGEGLIDGEDYSAKHYAQLAKVSEDIASGAIANIEEIEQQALDSITTGIGEIETAKEGALSLIDTTKDDAIDDIDTAKSNALIDIETSATNKITLINNTASSFEADLTLLTQRAETAAADAESSATNANSSATSASTSASNAATSESNASTYASNAYSFASSASLSATNAGNSASSASQSETNAQSYMNSANTYASNASSSATNAATSETNASNSATAAATSEDNAEIWAEGTDEQVQSLGGVHSSKGWSEISASGQINSDWAETDTTSKAYILNKPTNYVTTDTAQDISGRKTFLGEKAIYFKQTATADKLGFTLYNPSGTELGALEWRPNTINGNAILTLNCPQSGSNYVGFRYWSGINIIAPRPTTNGNYFIPVNVTDGTNTVTANNNGTLNISSLLPDVSDMATQTWVTSQNYVNGTTLTNTLADYVTNSALTTTLADYALLTDIPTVNNGTLTIQKNGTTVGTFTANQSTNSTINIEADTVLTDDATVSKNSDDELQAIGVIDDNAQNASKFTVVGSPTITDDGIASGFSTSNYITIPTITTTGIIEKISTNFVVDGSNTGNNVIFRIGSTWVYINSQSQGKRFSAKQPSQYGTEYLQTSFTPLYNTLYTAELILDKTNQKLTANCYQNDTKVATATVTSTLPTLFSEQLIIGQSSTRYFDGSIDLKQFKITVDGVKVYKAWQPPALKYWTGTKAQYDAIATKDANTLYNVESVGLYKGTTLISDKTTLYSTTGQNTDGAMTQKAVSDITENTRFDGQWVYSSIAIADSVTWNSSHGIKTYSLNNYLPNDGYNYEILFNGSCQTGTTSANFITVYVGIDNVNEDVICRLCTARTRTASSNQSSGSSNIIIPSNMRQLVVYGTTSSNANGTYSLWAAAYRRIGTNQ